MSETTIPKPRPLPHTRVPAVLGRAPRRSHRGAALSGLRPMGPLPASRCRHCLSDQLTWHELAGTGKVYTFSVARQPTTPQFLDETPQVIAVVELDDGPRVTTTIVGIDADDVRVGQPVRASFDHGDDGITLLRFSPFDATL